MIFSGRATESPCFFIVLRSNEKISEVNGGIYTAALTAISQGGSNYVFYVNCSNFNHRCVINIFHYQFLLSYQLSVSSAYTALWSDALEALAPVNT